MNRPALAALLFFIFIPTVGTTAEKIDWNDEQLAWFDYEAGIKELERTNKKGLLIIYADWCPACKQYSKLFSQEKAVKRLENLVLIRVNRDDSAAISKKYDFDGEYIPRTFALSTNGEVIQKAHPEKGEYRYFLSSDSIRPLLFLIKRLKRYEGQVPAEPNKPG